MGPKTFEALLPPDARLIDPRNEKVELVYDDRGLVDTDKLVQDIIATVDPDYEWSDELNVHHFYWPEAFYPYRRMNTLVDNPSRFRNLPINKGLMPQVFHTWLHLVTLPPIQPDPMVMGQRIEAWTIARELFKMARATVVSQKQAKRRRKYIADNPTTLRDDFNGEDIIGEEWIQEVMEKNFRGFSLLLDKQEQIPEDLRLLDIDQKPDRVATQLGRIIMTPSVSYVRQISAA